MKLPEGIEELPIENWENAHQNFKHTFKKGASFKLRLPQSLSNASDMYKKTTENLMWLIKYALDHNLKIRAMGSGWSFSKVAVTDGGLIDTKSLTLTFTLGPSFVNKSYPKNYKDLFFVQCGINIEQLNEKLENDPVYKRSLKASGNSNGQSLAGATSTGTHGSAFKVGAVHDSIVGLHIIVGGNRHVYVEKASNPVISDSFKDWLGAEVIKDDDVFNAAVVSFGSFGIIHGILLETEPIYLLEQQRVPNVPYDENLIKAVTSLDFSSISKVLPHALTDPNKELYHFEMAINPHDFKKGDSQKGVYIRTIYKLKHYEGYPKPSQETSEFEYGDDTLGFIQTVMDHLGNGIASKLIPGLVNKLFPVAYKITPPSQGTVGETFVYTKFRGNIASYAIAIDTSNIKDLTDMVLDANGKNPFLGVIGYRFVKGTQALLGFTRFEKTCIVELDGADSKLNEAFFENLLDKLDAKGIIYTLHWGKINYVLDPKRISNGYGDRLTRWLDARDFLMDKKTQQIFNNDLMQKFGLIRTDNSPLIS